MTDGEFNQWLWSSMVVLGCGIAAGVLLWALQDYRKWRSLGKGGLPANVAGWAVMTALRLLKRDPISTRQYDHRHTADARLTALPQRTGLRPSIAVYPVPHRQMDQLPGPEMQQKVERLFAQTVAQASNLLTFQLSKFETRHQAVFARDLTHVHPLAQETRGEIAHIHPSDGSMHMIFSPSDAKAVIEAGWGERHPLAGVLPHMHDTYVFIYPPRSEEELAVVASLLQAAIAALAGDSSL
ncbi:luciferase domain-containing protein [Nostoc sp.]|uniref:luciferase domain-containing protein n=1 Tax=Nostoc sp. TaxID=1180 RepID=UPI002FF71E6D